MKKLLFILVGVIMLSSCKTEVRHHYDLQAFDIQNSTYTERRPNADKTIKMTVDYSRGSSPNWGSFLEGMIQVIRKYDALQVEFDQGGGMGGGRPQGLIEFYNKLMAIDERNSIELNNAMNKVNTEREAYYPYPFKWSGFHAEIVVKCDRWYDVVLTSSSRSDKNVSITSTSEPVNNCTFDYVLEYVSANITLIPN